MVAADDTVVEVLEEQEATEAEATKAMELDS